MTADGTTLIPAADLAATNATHHPNESDEYRRARNALLIEEIEVRRHAERVARMRRALPLGGQIPRSYQFVAEGGAPVSIDDLFGDHDTLVVYSYMFGPKREAPCPMCTSFMAGFDHKIDDIRQRVSIAFTARSPIGRMMAAKQDRGWTKLPIYSDTSGDYTRDYVSADDGDAPALNVFVRHDDTIRHFWSEEIGPDMADPGQDPRSAIEMDALWLVLDATPGGRGDTWHPSLRY